MTILVSVADAREVFAYECLLRGLEENDGLISPGRMFDTARAAGLLFNLDRAARIQAIETFAEQKLKNEVFINFNPTSIYDPVYCLQSMMEVINKSSDTLPEHIVFEVTESEEIKDSRHLLNILNFYRESGFRVALDDLGAGYGSLNLMEKLRPDFVKLDIDLVRDVDTDPYKARIAAKLLEFARDLDVRVVAETSDVQLFRPRDRPDGAADARAVHLSTVRKCTRPPSLLDERASPRESSPGGAPGQRGP